MRLNEFPQSNGLLVNGHPCAVGAIGHETVAVSAGESTLVHHQLITVTSDPPEPALGAALLQRIAAAASVVLALERTQVRQSAERTQVSAFRQ